MTASQDACGDPGANWYLVGDLVETASDCNDSDYRINPATIRYEDVDTDGFADGTNNITQCAIPAGGNHYLPTDLI